MKLDSLKRTGFSEKKPHAAPSRQKFSFSDLSSREFSFSKKLKLAVKERFFSEIGMLLSAGVDLQTTLELSTQGSVNNKKLHLIYSKILAQLMKGDNLANAVELTGEFSNFDCYSILIGENTGQLAYVFGRMEVYYSKRIVQKRKITSALSYPLIILCTTIGAIYFMLGFVVPMFADTLIRFGGELPPITKAVIALSNHATAGLAVIFILAAGLVYFYRRNKENENFQRSFSQMLLKLPVIGMITRRIYLTHFTQAMDLLLSAKVSLLESVSITEKMIRFYPLSQALHQISIDITKGEFFYKSMEKQHFFDQSMITMIKIGEEINQLDRIFLQLSKKYETELDYQSGILLSFLEPALILILAIIVGFVLIAMYLPMFQIGNVIH
jgi:type IV pilus assembly protein PilC